MASRLGSFAREVQAFQSKREVDAAEREILNLLQGAGGLGTRVAEPIDPTRGIDLSPVPAPGQDPTQLDVSNVKLTPIRETEGFQSKARNLAAAEDRLSSAIAPVPAPDLKFIEGPRNVRAFEKTTGREVRKTPLDIPAESQAEKDLKAANLDLIKARTGQAKRSPSGGKPELTPAKSLKRISTLETSIAKLQVGKGADPLTLALMKDNPEFLKALQSNDVESAVAAMQREIAFHRENVPDKFRGTNKDPLGIR